MGELLHAIAILLVGITFVHLAALAYLVIFRWDELKEAAHHRQLGIAVDLKTNRWLVLHNGWPIKPRRGRKK